MLSVVKSGGTYGINGYVVDVEVNISQGLPQFTVVGLPDTAVKESRERVRSAIENIGYKFPVKKITVNLAPADVLKIGTLYDLPISIGILASSGIINENDLKDTAFIGELALNGDLRGVKGVLPIAIKLKEAGFKRFIVPLENEEEAAIVNGLDVYGFANLKEIVVFLNGNLEKQPKKIDVDELPNIKKYSFDAHNVPLAPFLKDLHNKGIEVVVIGCQGKEFTMPDIKPGLSEEVAKAVDKAIEIILGEIKK